MNFHKPTRQMQQPGSWPHQNISSHYPFYYHSRMNIRAWWNPLQQLQLQPLSWLPELAFLSEFRKNAKTVIHWCTHDFHYIQFQDCYMEHLKQTFSLTLSIYRYPKQSGHILHLLLYIQSVWDSQDVLTSVTFIYIYIWMLKIPTNRLELSSWQMTRNMSLNFLQKNRYWYGQLMTSNILIPENHTRHESYLGSGISCGSTTKCRPFF